MNYAYPRRVELSAAPSKDETATNHFTDPARTYSKS